MNTKLPPHPPSKSHHNVYAGAHVERASEMRKDEVALQAALNESGTLFVPVWSERNLLAWSNQSPQARLLQREEWLALRMESGQPIFLGRFRSQACFAVEIQTDPPSMSPAEFADLRKFGDLLQPDEASLLAYARAMVIWHSRHRFCGRCGSATLSIAAGHSLNCSNPECNLTQFPRIDPAIIVLVTDGESALLGRGGTWPAGRYSTIAGFVEPGESLEDAVAREVREETNIEVTGVRYHSSQPWPFPTSLMLGFTARATSTAIDCRDAELEDARWFTREDIAAGKLVVSSPQSIAFRLIEDWYDAGSQRPLRSEPGARIASSRT